MSRARWLLVVAGLTSIVIVLFFWRPGHTPSGPQSPSRLTESDPAKSRDVVVGPNENYVSSESCRECHEVEHASWYATYHRTMTQRATAESVLAPIDDISLHSRNRTFRLWREGEEFWVEMPDPDIEDRLQKKGVDLLRLDEVPYVRRRIVMTTGSHNYQAYWIHGAHGSELRQVPFVYHLGLQRWLPREDAFLRPDSNKRMFAIWNAGCIQCHCVAGRPGLDVEADTLYSTAVENSESPANRATAPANSMLRFVGSNVIPNTHQVWRRVTQSLTRPDSATREDLRSVGNATRIFR